MLPTNPQSLTAADRSVLDNLRQQGEQIDRQTKVLETLIDRVTRQMRSDEKLEKGSKKDKTEIGKDTRVKDVPGVLFDKFSDGLNDAISTGFNKIKDKFKDEKSKPAEKPKEPSAKDKPPKDTDKAPKDGKDVLKNILNNMVTTSKYQEQMLEHTKAIQSIADKTLVSIDSLKNIVQPEDNPNIESPQNTEIDKPNQKENDVQNVVQPKDNIKIENSQNTEIDKPKQTEDDTKKIKSNTKKQVPALFLSKEKLENDTDKTTLNSNDGKLPNSIGIAVGKALKPQFDTLGKIFKDSLKEGFDQLDESISNLGSTGLPPIIPTPTSTVSKNPAAARATATAASRAAGIAKGALKVGVPLSLATYSSDAGHTQKEEDALLEKARQKGFVPESPDKKIGLREEKPSQVQVGAMDNKIDELAKKEQPKKLGFGPGMKAPVTAEDYKKISLDNKIDEPVITAKPEKLGFGPGMKAPVTAEDYKKIATQKLQKNTSENLKIPEAAPTANDALNPAPAVSSAITQKKAEKTSLMKEVTDEKTALASDANKTSAPVIVNNTTNNMSEQGSSMNFASATSTNPNDSVRDYKRNNARLFDSA